jgi:hypothetical protein
MPDVATLIRGPGGMPWKWTVECRRIVLLGDKWCPQAIE